MRFQTWQELLKFIIENSYEKQRIARALRVNVVTLTRWVHYETQPRKENMVALAKAIPDEYYDDFVSLVRNDWPEFAQQAAVAESGSSTPPSEFYARILSAYATIPSSLYPQSLYDLILQQAIEQLDPSRQGMSISIVGCVVPLNGGPVRSLRELAGIGNPPWKRDLEHSRSFLGVESLAGAAVTHLRLVCIQNREEQFTLFPAQWVTHEQSAAAYPITRQTEIAGCLLVSSAVPNYFSSHINALIERYAHLTSLAFTALQFFAYDDIQLHMMPHYNRQIPLLNTFQQRVARKFVEAAQQHQFITLDIANRAVWQDIEEELLQLSPSSLDEPL